MHHVIERFVGRYEVWRRSVPLRNPLNIPALVLATSIAQAVYQIATSRQLAWGAAVLLCVDFAFLLLYLRRSPWAWLILPVWGAMALIQLPFTCFGFSALSLSRQCGCCVSSSDHWLRIYRMGPCDSAALP